MVVSGEPAALRNHFLVMGVKSIGCIQILALHPLKCTSFIFWTVLEGCSPFCLPSNQVWRSAIVSQNALCSAISLQCPLNVHFEGCGPWIETQPPSCSQLSALPVRSAAILWMEDRWLAGGVKESPWSSWTDPPWMEEEVQDSTSCRFILQTL